MEGAPSTIEGAYVYPSDPAGDDRSFIDDFDTITAATERWLAAERRRSLREGTLSRTPTSGDCQFCPFKPVSRAPCSRAGETSCSKPKVAHPRPSDALKRRRP